MSRPFPATFPAGFLWGVSVGAHQSEGNNIASDWWYRETPSADDDYGLASQPSWPG